MRGLAFRRQQAKAHYLSRAHKIYSTYGGYYVSDGKLVKRSESFNDYIERANPYLLKTQGNFESHGDFWSRVDKHKQKVKEKVRANKEMHHYVQETD